jgi:thiamine transporter 2/3
VSSFTRAALLFGRCSSGIFSQILTINDFLDYRQLNFVSLGSVCLALVFSLFLPSVERSIYFDRKEESSSSSQLAGN